MEEKTIGNAAVQMGIARKQYRGRYVVELRVGFWERGLYGLRGGYGMYGYVGVKWVGVSSVCR